MTDSPHAATSQLLGGLIIVLGVAIARTDRVTAFGGWLRERLPT